MGGLTQPKRLTTGREQGADAISRMFQQALQGQMQPGQLGQIIQSQFTTPGYGGRLSAGMRPEQQQAYVALRQLMGQGNSRDSTLAGLGNFMTDTTQTPQAISQLFAGIPGSGGPNDPLGAIMTGGTPIQQGLMAGVPTPERSALSGMAGGNTPQALGLLTGLFNQQAGGAGGGMDFNSIAASLDAARRPGLQRDVRDIREMFSSQGLRESSNLAEAVAGRQGESETAMMAELARIAPQLMGAQTGQLQALTGLGQSIGGLELGGQSNLIQALTQAGQLGLGAQGLNLQGLETVLGSQLGASQLAGQMGLGQADILSQLFQGGQNRQLQALLGMPGVEGQFNQNALDQIGALFGMGSQIQGQDQADIMRQYQAWLQTQSLFPQALGFLGGAPPPTYGPSPLQTGMDVATTAATIGATK